MTERDKLPLAIEVGRRALSHRLDNESERRSIRSYLILALIGVGQYPLALETIGDPESVLSRPRPDDIFNYAIAKWGVDGTPPLPFFRRLLEAVAEQGVVPDANLYQCLALAHMVLGQDTDALASLEYARWRARTGERAFSCWRYLEVTGRAMLNDLAVMEKAVGVKPTPEPEFFAEVRRLIA